MTLSMKVNYAGTVSLSQPSTGEERLQSLSFFEDVLFAVLTARTIPIWRSQNLWNWIL